MHVDDIADRIAIARQDELDWIVRNMWVDHTHGLLTDNEMEALDEAARARREALQARPEPHRGGIGRKRAMAAKRGAKRAIRATKRAAEWRKNLHRAHGYLRSRIGEEEGRALDAELERQLAAGPDFARYRGGSDFRDAPAPRPQCHRQDKGRLPRPRHR
jgi:hypothetical protein